MAEVNLDVAMESTSQEILKKTQNINMGVNGLLSVGSTITCTASDNVLLSLVTSEINSKDIGSTGITIGTIKSNKVSGKVRIRISMKVTQGNVRLTLGSTQLINNSNSDATSYKTYTADFAIEDGKTYTLSVNASMGSYAYVNMATICGDLSEPVVDAPSIKVV